MDKRKLKIALSLAVLIPCVLYAAGIIAQFIININAWKSAGSDYRTSPGLPSSQISEVVRALFHFPEGLIAIGVVVLGIAVLCVFGLRIGWGQNGVTDSDRNLTVSNSGSYGTASFMSPKEASACFEVTSAKRTSQDILGMLPDGQVLTLPKDTRLNANLAVCGSSGTGKSRAISRNLVLQAVKRGESVILTDPKSELYESMGEYLRENGYIVKVFNLVEMDHSDSWNCLGEVGSSELMAQTFADIVLQNTSGDSKDAFWYNAELNLLKALVLYVALEMPPEKRNIATVYDLLYTQTEKGLSDMMASISHEHANQYTGELLPPSPASAPYAIFRQSSETVRTSVIIGLGSKLAVLQAQQVRNITSYNEIDLELPGKQKCAYFCIVSDQDSTYDFLSSLFFSFLFIRLIRYADAYCEGGMLHPKVKFILDEFPNCCLIPDFTKKCSTIRSRGCSVAVFFQNVGQMRNRYPDDQWQEILGACDSTVFLGCTDMLTAEYFSDRIGTASVEVEGTMRELNTMHITDYTPRFRKTNSLGRRPLLTPDEVLRLPPDQVLIFIRGQKVMRAKRFDYSLHPDYKKLKSRKAILHEPDWKSSQASSVSASGVSSPSVTAAIPVEKANVGSQKKPPGKPPRSTTRKVVNADELFWERRRKMPKKKVTEAVEETAQETIPVEKAPAQMPRRQGSEDLLELNDLERGVTREDSEEAKWGYLAGAVRRQQILTGIVSAGMTYTENGMPIVPIDFEGLCVKIPVREMTLIEWPEDEPIPRSVRVQIGRMLGATIDFIPAGVDFKERVAIGSRKAAMLQRQKRYYASGRVKPGILMACRVLTVGNNTMMVEACGVDTEIYARNVSWEWFSDIADLHSTGDLVVARVLDVTYNEQRDTYAVNLSIKDASENPDRAALEKIVPNSNYFGVVTGVKDRVFFVRLQAGVNAKTKLYRSIDMPSRLDTVSFRVTRVDEENGIALGFITRIIKRHTRLR